MDFMAGGKLSVNTTAVQSLGQNLATVRSTLEGASASSEALAGMVGEPKLAAVVSDFSGQWDDRRAELMAQMDSLKEKASAVAEGFEQVDSELAKALTEEV
jgi:hypothetical protein